MSLDMRKIEPGCAIDEFHYSMWAGFIEFSLKQHGCRAEFEAETGKTFPKGANNGLEAMIDQACGFDRSAEQLAYIAEFARWVTPRYFGGPEDICPAIATKLAQGMPSEGPRRECGSGASAPASPVPQECAPTVSAKGVRP